MKTIKIPCYPVLEYLDLTSVQRILETKTERTYIEIVNWEEYPYKPISVVDIVRSNKALYINYFVKGLSIKAIHTEDGSPVHKDSCVEFFMKKEESDTYINFEFNCIGVCDAAHRVSRDIKTEFTLEEYASIKRHTSIAREKRNGNLDEDNVSAWNLLVMIPFETMGLDPENLPEKILGNFYKCADETKNPHYLSWNPIDLPSPDFHCPKYFGEIYL